MIALLMVALAHAGEPPCEPKLASQIVRAHPRYIRVTTRGEGPVGRRSIENANGTLAPDEGARAGFDFVHPELRRHLKLQDVIQGDARRLQAPRPVAWYGPIKSLGPGLAELEYAEILIDDDEPGHRSAQTLDEVGAAVARGRAPIFIERWEATDFVRQAIAALITPTGYLAMMHAAFTAVTAVGRRGAIVDERYWRLRPLLLAQYEAARRLFGELVETDALDDVEAFAARVGVLAATLEVREPAAFVERCVTDPAGVARELQIHALGRSAGPGLRLRLAEALARRERVMATVRLKNAAKQRKVRR